MSRRTTRYTLGKSNNRTYVPHGSKQQSHGDADDKAQLPLRITVPAIKHRSAKYATLQTINRQCCRTHGQITVRFENNHDDVRIYSKRLSELPQFPSVSLISNSVFLIILSFWPPNYIEEKAVTVNREKRSRSVKITPRGRRDVNTQLSITPRIGCMLLKITTGDVNHLPSFNAQVAA